jgi:hypothetical protein
MESCAKHPHEMGEAICRRCGGAWCKDCLVYSFGPKKPPFCLTCAMVAGGVRSGAARPAMPKREMKARAKAAKAEAKAAAKAAKQAEREEAETPLEPAAMTETDWSAPWWEDRQPTLAD